MWRGDLTEGVLRYWIGGPIFGGAYTRRGLFSGFYGIFFITSNFFFFITIFSAGAFCVRVKELS